MYDNFGVDHRTPTYTLSRTPAVSVIIPLYNKVPHIKRALDSVLAQTYQDFEVIVVNDGSTDGSEKTVEEYLDPRIRLVHRVHINSWGGHAARNLGIAEARADLTAFLDADDEWLPDYLRTIMSLRSRFPGAAAWSTTYYQISRDGIQMEWEGDVSVVEGDREAGIVDIFARNARPFCTDSVVIRKATLVSIGGFPEGVANGGDLDTWYRLAFRFPIACCLKPEVKYYRNVINPIDVEACMWVGVRPYFASLNRFIAESGGQDRVPKEVVDFMMREHYSCYRTNLVAGNRGAARRVACDFMKMKGFALQGFVQFLATLAPSWLLHLLWRLRRLVKYRTWKLPEMPADVRKIYP